MLYSIWNFLDLEMADGSQITASLKPVGKIGKKSKKGFKMSKSKRRGKGSKGKIGGKRHIWLQ